MTEMRSMNPTSLIARPVGQRRRLGPMLSQVMKRDCQVTPVFLQVVSEEMVYADFPAMSIALSYKLYRDESHL